MIILEENFKRHLEAFASKLFKYKPTFGPNLAFDFKLKRPYSWKVQSLSSCNLYTQSHTLN